MVCVEYTPKGRITEIVRAGNPVVTQGAVGHEETVCKRVACVYRATVGVVAVFVFCCISTSSNDGTDIICAADTVRAGLVVGGVLATDCR
jgi:hypothetical protein